MKLHPYLHVLKELIYLDLTIFKINFWNKVIDLAIWVTLTLFVSGYIMPYFGLANFGVFQLGGILAATGLFEVYSTVVDLIVDLEGDRLINYNLTLPAPSWVTITSKVISHSLIYLTLALLMLPLGLACLWPSLSFASISWVKLITMFILQSLFYGCFGLWAASMVDSVTNVGTVWARFIFPLWFMGGFQFSWKALHAVTPLIAFINLLNPLIYVTEGVRTALLGQTGYLPFWVCCCMLALCSIFCFVLAFKSLKKRLDFI